MAGPFRTPSRARPARQRRWRRLAATFLVAGGLVAACGSEGADDPLVAEPSFYVPPDPLPPGEPGDVLRSERIPGAPGGGPVWRVLYRSESLAGEAVAVSGIVAAPPGPPPEGGWPVLSLAHGTVGLADHCAPSREPGITASEAATRGFVVVATDYEGLGPPGGHPYLVGETAGRNVIDAVRAARNLGDEVAAGQRYVVLGFSQGGHAALFANQIAPTWAPELELVGTAAGAPVVELRAWMDHLMATDQAWVVSMVIAGFTAVEPAVDPAAVLAPAGRDLFSMLDDTCLPGVLAAVDQAEGEQLARSPAELPVIAALLDANTPGQVAGAAPVLIVHGTDDGLVPPALVDALVARLCAAGQVVERRDYAGVDHAEVIAATLVDANAWLLDRLQGGAAASSC